MFVFRNVQNFDFIARNVQNLHETYIVSCLGKTLIQIFIEPTINSKITHIMNFRTLNEIKKSKSKRKREGRIYQIIQSVGFKLKMGQLKILLNYLIVILHISSKLNNCNAVFTHILAVSNPKKHRLSNQICFEFELDLL